MSPQVFVILLACASACHTSRSSEADAPVELDPRIEGLPFAYFSEDGSFFDLPFPSDLRKNPDGTLELDAWPNPFELSLLQEYIDAASSLTGFGTNSAMYLRLSEPPDLGTLPADPQAALSSDASVFLVNLDSESSDYGRRHPVEYYFRETATPYWPSHTLAVRPMLGIPLDGDTTYGLVLTDDVRTEDGESYVRDRYLEQLLFGATGDGQDEARAVLRPLIDWAQDSGIALDRLRGVTVFTTQDPRAELETLRQWMLDNVDPPLAMESAWRVLTHAEGFTLLEGRFDALPVFQQGDAPYFEDGGDIQWVDGEPILQDVLQPRFALSIPADSTSPGLGSAGYPIVVYAHGSRWRLLVFRSQWRGTRLGRAGHRSNRV
ncbi:MAG: hypothetical protein AAF550_02835 [Myxococcota bacterium]